MAPRRTILLFALALSSSSLACKPALEGAAKSAAQTATQQAAATGWQALSDEESRRRLLAVVESPEMKQAMATIAADLTRGVAESIARGEGSLNAEEVARRISETATKAAVQSALAAAMGPESEAKWRHWATGVGDAAARSAMRALAEELPATIGPALGAVIRDDVNPTLRDAATGPAVQTALASAAYTVSRQAVLGSDEALSELEHGKDHGQRPSWMARAAGLVAGGTAAGLVALLGLAAAVGALTVALVHSRAQVRRQHAAGRGA